MSQYYIGVKQVFAYPEMKGDTPGYHVVYDYDTPREYHSWSPKDVFESAYLPMGEANDGSKITQEMVDGFTKVVGLENFDMPDGGRGADPKMTVLFVELKNGTLYAESSACVDPKNYSEEIGREVCLKRAKERVWHLLGFALQWARKGLS